MKKVLRIILIVVVLLIILIAGFITYLFLQRESEISKLPDYYQDLAEKCRGLEELGISKSSTNCCLKSVMIMAKENFNLIYLPYPGEVSPKPECSEGFRINSLRCEGSYEWCEPVE